MRYQVLVLPSELAGPADISGVAFYCNSTTYYYGTFGNVEVKLCHTNLGRLKDNFDANYAGNTPVTVFSASSYPINWTSDAWNDLMFDTPFSYNGSDSLILEFSFLSNDGNAVYNMGWYPVGGNRVLDGFPSQPTGYLRTYMNSMRIYYTLTTTVSAELTCVPDAGSVPFNTVMTASMTNNYTGLTRRLAGQIDVDLAGGQRFTNWKSGWSNVNAGSSLVSSWNQNIPALGSVIGNNIFQLSAEDVTPAPYNQAPHPPSGDTDVGICTVVGIAP